MTAGSSNEDCTAITDGWLPLQNSHYLPPEDMYLEFGAAMGATITEARLNAPSLREVSLPSIAPVNVGATVPSLMPHVLFNDNPLKLNKLEELAFETSNGAAGAEIHRGLFAARVGPKRPAPPGEVITVRFTATPTSVAETWVGGAITLTQGLPSGQYSVVGMDVRGTTLIAARLRFPDQGPLPGCVARAATSITPLSIFRSGRLGEWGRFRNTALPLLEVLNSGAVSSYTGYLDLVRL